MTELHVVIMNKEDFSFSEADDLIKEMRDQVLNDGYMPEDILYENGYDADYVMDLLM